MLTESNGAKHPRKITRHGRWETGPQRKKRKGAT